MVDLCLRAACPLMIMMLIMLVPLMSNRSLRTKAGREMNQNAKPLQSKRAPLWAYDCKHSSLLDKHCKTKAHVEWCCCFMFWHLVAAA
eukprot:5401164-Amphidinium_carterae.1